MAKKGTVELSLDLAEGANVKKTVSSVKSQIAGLQKKVASASKDSGLAKYSTQLAKAAQRAERLDKNALQATRKNIMWAKDRIAAIDKQLGVETRLAETYEQEAKTNAEILKSRKYISNMNNMSRHTDTRAALLEFQQAEERKLKRKDGKYYADSTLLKSEDALAYYATQSHEAEGLSRTVQTLADNIAKVEQEEQKAAATATELEQIKASAEVSNASIVQLRDRLAELEKEQEMLESAGLGLGDAQFDKNVSEIDAIKVALKEYEATLQTTSAKLKEEARAEREAEREARRQQEAQQQARKSLLESAAGASKLGSAILQLSSTLHQMSLASNSGNSALERLSQITQTIAPIAGAVGKVFENTRNVLSKIVGVAKKVSGSINGLSLHFKSAGGSSESFGAKLKRLTSIFTKYVFGFRSFFYLYRKLRGQIGEGFKELASGVPSVNEAFSTILTSLYTLRANFAAAFEPIISVIAPILNTLIQKLNDATVAIANFFATLTGKGTILRAIVNQQDYAASLNSTAKSAGSASKALDKFTAGIDELNVIDEDSSSSGGSSADDIVSRYEEIAAEQSLLAGLVGLIVDSWKNADFTQVGEILGTKLKEALESIPWDEVSAFVEKVAKSLATLINGFIKAEDLDKTIGSTLGEAINTAVNGISTFANTIEWKKLATFITNSIQSFLTTTDFEKAGQAIFDLLGNALFTAVEVTGNSQTWDLAAQKICEFISNLHWPELLVRYATLGGNILRGIAKAIISLSATSLGNSNVWKGVGKKVGNIISSIPWGELFVSLVTIATAILSGIAEAIANIKIDKEASRTYWCAAGAKIGELIANINWKAILGNMLALTDGIMEGIGAAIEAATGLPAGSGKHIAELIGIAVLGSGLAKIIAKIVGSGGLLSAFKQKDDALDKQTAKTQVETEAVTDMAGALEGAGETAGVAANSLVGAGLVAVPAIEGVTTAISNLETQADTSSATVQTISAETATQLDTDATQASQTLTDTAETTSASLVEASQQTADGIEDSVVQSSTAMGGAAEAAGIASSDMQTAFGDAAQSAGTNLVTNIGGDLQIYNDNLYSCQQATGEWAQNTLHIYDEFADGVNSAMVSASKDIEEMSEGETVKSHSNSVAASVFGAIAGYAASTMSSASKLNLTSVFDSIGSTSTSSAIGGTAAVGTVAAILALLNSLGVSPLASGAVLPANHPFLAMVGDQTHGTNVEAPLETIKQAVAEVSNSYEVVSAIQTLTSVVEALNLTVNLDGKRVESNSRSVSQRRGAVIARGGIFNYA